ncbi:protease Lon-related BREX system protein BrxL [Candidatus Nomurabacteria bacterium]|nr:protease Lon-related BREX system protein BrxL [Candidatus Nomurabacteria bacterium]
MDLETKLLNYFAGRVVRKDLTKLIKEGQNVPIYVLEYLLGQYCATDDEVVIKDGIAKVKSILAENYVRPDEAEKVKSRIREKGSYTIIDKIDVRLNEKKDIYTARFSNLGLKDVELSQKYVKEYDKLLAGGIWCIVEMEYFYNEDDKNGQSPFIVRNLKPIQIPNVDLNDVLEARKNFTKEEWIDLILQSIGLEPTQFEEVAKWHLLLRLVPLIENNYNLCELGPRSTGKSYVYQQISPNSILVSGGQTTVANLFFNMSSNQMGLVGMWDVVAFDEVAGIKFKDKDGVQIMKNYMANGMFSRGKDTKVASASMVFVGNINQSVESLLHTSHLFAPFPDQMNNDSAFFDRMHYYLPGWEIPKFRPNQLTDKYGFIVDYLAEFLRDMRKRSFSDGINNYFKLGSNLNKRDSDAVKKTFSGLMKLIYPDEVYTKEDAEEVLIYALQGRRRVKEQLKKIGGMEFYDVHFSYIDNDSLEEKFVSLPESGSSKLIPEGQLSHGTVYTIGKGTDGMIGVFKLETQVVKGSGSYKKSGLDSNSKAKESVEIAFNYFKANAKSVSGTISTKERDYLLQAQDLQGIGMTSDLALSTFIALTSGAMEKPVLERLAVIGNMTIGGSISKLENLADMLQVAFDAGAKKILIPASSAVDMATVPPELISKFQTIYYEAPIDAVFKALGVE